MSTYRIWFDVGDRIVELPVNPQEVAITYPGNPTNYDVEGLGEIIVPRIPKLATLSFESFFPRDGIYVPMVNSDSWYTPEWYVTFFRNLQRSRQPFELTIVRGSDPIVDYDGGFTETRQAYYDTILKAVLLDITTTDKGGEPGDVYYTMTLSEYRDASPKTMAELASESYDFSGEVLEQEMVLVRNRPPQKWHVAIEPSDRDTDNQSGKVVANQTVEVTGRVYLAPDEKDDEWLNQRATITQATRTIMRVLPPSEANRVHSCYIMGMGWVDSRNCEPDYQSNFYRLKSLY